MDRAARAGGAKRRRLRRGVTAPAGHGAAREVHQAGVARFDHAVNAHTRIMDGTTGIGGRAAQTLPLIDTIARVLGIARDDSRPASAVEVHGEPDGPPTRLPSGVMIYRRRMGRHRVSDSAYLQAVRAVRMLPAAHQAAIARAGVPVWLVPSVRLEDGLLGATTIVQDVEGGAWRPTLVRVAVAAGRSNEESTPEIVQHELGHVIAVLSGQDRSEAAAEAYARRY